VADLQELVEFLDDYLDVRGTPDYSGAWNGLQVYCRSPIESVRVATDACQATIDESYRRLKALLEGDMALYSAHIPLDIHPDVGNNVLLAGQLDLTVEGTFGVWRDLVGAGVWAVTDVSLREFVGKVEEVCGDTPRVVAGGPAHVRRVGIATGSAASLIEQAHAEGLDTFVTGEGSHHSFHDATELGVNVIYAGHYATETAGVRALGELLSDRYGVECRFVDHPTGM